jgi:hypothetical protein
MADAPSGGGGMSGGEIILLVVLALGAFAVLTGHPLAGLTNENSSTTSSTTSQKCGIVINRPASKERISGVATVVGSITPCNNTTPLSTLVNVQVVDSTGAPMSAYTPVSIAAADSSRGTFNANIPITGNPAPGTGYVIVTGPNNANSITTSARVAITFGPHTVIYSGTTTTTTNTGSYFVPNPNITPSNTSGQAPQTYNPTPTQNYNPTPVQQNPQPVSTPSSGGGTTF